MSGGAFGVPLGFHLFLPGKRTISGHGRVKSGRISDRNGSIFIYHLHRRVSKKGGTYTARMAHRMLHRIQLSQLIVQPGLHLEITEISPRCPLLDSTVDSFIHTRNYPWRAHLALLERVPGAELHALPEHASSAEPRVLSSYTPELPLESLFDHDFQTIEPWFQFKV